MKLDVLLPEETRDTMRVYARPLHGTWYAGGVGRWLRIPRGGLDEQKVREYLCFHVGLLGVARRSEHDGALSVVVIDEDAKTQLAQLPCADGPPRQGRAYMNVSLALSPDPGIAGFVVCTGVVSVNSKTLNTPESRNMLFYTAGYLCRKTWARAQAREDGYFSPQSIWLDGFNRKVMSLYRREANGGA